VDTDTSASLAATATRLGVVDALIFRRLSASRWAHLGGLGRGCGWAGLVDVDAAQDPMLAQLPEEPGGVRTFGWAQVARVVGPYYATAGAFVRVSNDVVVVLGNPSAPLAADATVEQLRSLAVHLDRFVPDVTPAKRLADELEVLHAIRAVTTGSARNLDGTLRHILAVAVEALSCEVGLLRDGRGNLVTTSSWSGVDVSDPAVGETLDVLEQRTRGGSLCVQDTDIETVPAPLGREQGVRSLLAMTMPDPVGGILVVAHTSAGPRGFTALCQQLGRQLCDASGVVAHTAGLRDELHALVDEHSRTARRDPLTDLGNRLDWDEALVRAQARVDAGGVTTVITLDVDGLKRVNDSHGHEAGDRLLVQCANVLRQHGREGDVMVRLGGDEFALLLPVADHLAEQRVSSLRAALGSVTSGRFTVAASVGTATVSRGGSVADAARDADAAMYAEKRARRVADHPA